MMGIINMAPANLSCAGPTSRSARSYWVSIIAAQLCGAIVAGLIGVLIEVVIVRRFYKRPEDRCWRPGD
jgi:branched-chain amino acid transport system permease protein